MSYQATRYIGTLESDTTEWLNWTELKCILLSVRNQCENAMDCIIPNMWLYKRQNYEDSKKKKELLLEFRDQEGMSRQ